MLRFAVWNAFHARKRNIRLHRSEPPAGFVVAAGQQHSVRRSSGVAMSWQRVASDRTEPTSASARWPSARRIQAMQNVFFPGQEVPVSSLVEELSRKARSLSPEERVRFADELLATVQETDAATEAASSSSGSGSIRSTTATKPNLPIWLHGPASSVAPARV